MTTGGERVTVEVGEDFAVSGTESAPAAVIRPGRPTTPKPRLITADPGQGGCNHGC